jgi:hypothetical protein
MENKLPIAQALNEIMKAVGGIAKKDKNTAKDLTSAELILSSMQYRQHFKSSV